MSEPAVLQTWSPVIQYGFAGFSVLLLMMIVWLVKQLLRVLQETNEIIRRNTEALNSMNATAMRSRELMDSIHDCLLARPCLMDEEELRKKISAPAQIRGISHE